MKKPILILLTVATLAVVTYLACYHFATRETRQMLGASDDIAWLRSEYSLNDEQARDIAALQTAYEPHCMEMCAKIAHSGERLERLLSQSKTMTTELEAALREASQTQIDCRAATLTQAFAISAHISPEQAARYRAMVAERVLAGYLPHTTMTQR